MDVEEGHGMNVAAGKQLLDGVRPHHPEAQPMMVFGIWQLRILGHGGEQKKVHGCATTNSWSPHAAKERFGWPEDDVFPDDRATVG